MPKHNKEDLVTASFHFAQREVKKEGHETEIVAFTQAEFDSLCDKILNQPAPDLTDLEQFNAIKFGRIVPFKDTKRVDQRCLFGVYENSYWGHSYRNSDKGDISADSINQRKFHFLLYLSDSGRIYIASQYLGHFGGYTSLSKTIKSYLDKHSEIEFHSFRQDEIDLRDAVAKEVKVSISSKNKKISSDNFFSSGSMVAVRKRSADDGFEEEVRKSLFSLRKSPIEKKKQALAEMMRKSLIDVSDADIENCTIVASIDGRDHVIYLLGSYDFASRFLLNVAINFDGHPKYEETFKAMYGILEHQIIAVKENV